jgi:DNA-binding IclR family transcriptional regulator
MLRAAVLDALTDAPQGKDTIARTVGASPTTVRRILDGLAAEGLARNEGRGWTHTTGEQQ